jgi:hypothetical protein
LWFLPERVGDELEELLGEAVILVTVEGMAFSAGAVVEAGVAVEFDDGGGTDVGLGEGEDGFCVEVLAEVDAGDGAFDIPAGGYPGGVREDGCVLGGDDGDWDGNGIGVGAGDW